MDVSTIVGGALATIEQALRDVLPNALLIGGALVALVVCWVFCRAITDRMR